MEYYYGLKRNEVLYATTWVNLENIILSEISQSEKKILCESTSVRYLNRAIKFRKTESRTVVTRIWGEGQNGGCHFMGIVSVLQEEKLWRADSQQHQRT